MIVTGSDWTPIIENDFRTGREMTNLVSDAGKYLFGFSTEKYVNDISAKIAAIVGQQGNLTAYAHY